MAALASFTRVLELEAGDKGEWGFKALKQMIKINFKMVSYCIIIIMYHDFLVAQQ